MTYRNPENVSPSHVMSRSLVRDYEAEIEQTLNELDKAEEVTLAPEEKKESSVSLAEITTIELLVNNKAKELVKKHRMFDEIYNDKFYIHLVEGPDWAVMTKRGIDEDDQVRIILYYEPDTFLAIFKSQDLWDNLIKPALKKIPLLYNNSKEPFATAFKVWHRKEYGRDGWLKMKYNVHESEVLELVTDRVNVERMVTLTITDPYTGYKHKVEKTERIKARDLPLNMQLALTKDIQQLDRERFKDCIDDEELAEKELEELKKLKDKS